MIGSWLKRDCGIRICKIDIDFFGIEDSPDYRDAPSVAALLLDSGLVRSTVETLTVQRRRLL